MKLKYFNYLILFSLTAVLFSCSKDFLDSDEDQYLTKERIGELKESSPESVLSLVQGSLNGIYNNNNVYRTRHDDFGMKAVHLATDLTCLDMVQVQHHWFGYDYNVSNRQSTYRRPAFLWKFFYEQVSSSNLILQDFFEEEAESEVLKQKEGETKAWRGIAYYYLVNLFQQTYVGNESAAGVPLVLKPTDEDMPRAKVSEVYAQIVEDLEYAVSVMSNTDVKTDIDKAVAAAYLAKTYASMENWAKVEEYAKIAIQGQSLASASLLISGKWDISNSDWLWGYDVSGETTTFYASFYSHIDNTIGGYAGGLGIYKNIYSNLYDKITSTDARKQLYINTKFFPEQAAYKLPTYANIKYRTAMDFTGDYCFLRTEDPYLLLIESYVEQNKLGDAKDALNTFASSRDANYDVNKFTSQSDLREEVRTQRRIELWGEGTSFFDFKRWKIPNDRTLPGSNHRTQIVVPVGDKRWTYQIPQSEMDANPNIGAQNP